MVGFEEGYKFFVDNSSAIVGAEMSGSYVGTVDEEIKKLINDLNSLEGFKTSSKMLKGDVAEFWHSGTFNIKAALDGSDHRAFVDRSHDFASTDISTNFGDRYGLKFYSDGQASANAELLLWVPPARPYAVEFLDDAAIFSKYGENGITEYSLVNGVAEISDDTQMTLFTANALLLGTTRGMTRGIMGSYPSYISLCYKEWLRTQYEQFPLNEEYSYTWLINVPELFARRAPGNTCISAIENGANGTLEEPINRSKGCGGIMRVAPIGLYFEGKRYSVSEIDKIGAETAALTHGHELGYIPAAALVHILHILSHNEDVKMLDAVLDMKKAISREFVNAKHLSEQIALIDKAIDLVNEDVDDLEAIRELGQGWVAEETLAIAIYCALKYSDDFDKALIASVNHSGDSDSIGAVTGNILGAYLGLSGIPEKYLENLELKNVILELADDLFNDCKITEYGSYHDEIWEQKYIYKTYRPKR